MKTPKIMPTIIILKILLKIVLNSLLNESFTIIFIPLFFNNAGLHRYHLKMYIEKIHRWESKKYFYTFHLWRIALYDAKLTTRLLTLFKNRVIFWHRYKNGRAARSIYHGSEQVISDVSFKRFQVFTGCITCDRLCHVAKTFCCASIRMVTIFPSMLGS